ncbi:MAG: hypothetical protein ACP5GX_10560, partial [Anaerolineae bacterium]
MRTDTFDRVIRLLLFVIGLLLVVMLSLVALRGVVQALPGRYAYYLPEPLLDLRRVPHEKMLSTPEVNSTPPVNSLLPTTTPTSPPPTNTPTALPTTMASSTPVPTETPTPIPTPTPTLPASCLIEGGRMERQGWNNCGPTTLAMQLSFWQRLETQQDIAPILKPDPEDKNVG